MSSFIRLPLYFALFITLGLIFGFITFKILSFSRTAEVPSLSNLTLLEANDALNKVGLYLKIEGEDYDPLVPAGKILRQDIPAGKAVKVRRSIKVVVSKGPRVLSVPSLVGLLLPEAESSLVQLGLRIGKAIHVHSDSVEKGKIISQKPEPDEKLTERIIVLVSLGPHQHLYYCPDFAGRPAENARETASRLGLSVETRGAGNYVASQRPKPGVVVKSGDTVILELKEVPING